MYGPKRAKRRETDDGDKSATFDPEVTSLKSKSKGVGKQRASAGKTAKVMPKKVTDESSREEADPSSLPAEYKGRPVIYMPDRASLRQWLQENWSKSKGVWFAFARKGSGLPRLPYAQVVEELLCWGWIDSLVNTYSEDFTVQMLTPRKKGSQWSGLNKGRVEKLLSEGLIAEPGLAVIDTAKKDGSWTILDAVERLEEPDDLVAALNAAGAKAKWDAFSPSSRKGILHWIHTAKREETRNNRIEITSRMAAKGLRAQFDKE